MPAHQALLGGRSTYTRGVVAVHTTTNPPHFLSYPYDNGMWYAGVGWLGQNPGSSYTGAEMYSFTAANAPIVQKTLMSPQRLMIGTAYGKSTPPGYGIFKEIYGSNTLYRLNADGVWEYITLSGAPAQGISNAEWSDDQQALYCMSGGAVIQLSNLNWAAHTHSTDSTTFATAGYAQVAMARNACIYDGRCYVYNATNGDGKFGWVNTLTGVHTLVYDYANWTSRPIICAPTYLGSTAYVVCQNGDSGQADKIDVWDMTDTLVGSISLPGAPTTAYGQATFCYDYINNYVWCRLPDGFGFDIYVLNLNNLSVRDTYANTDFPNPGDTWSYFGSVGSPYGGIYMIGKGTVNFDTIYKVG